MRLHHKHNIKRVHILFGLLVERRLLLWNREQGYCSVFSLTMVVVANRLKHAILCMHVLFVVLLVSMSPMSVHRMMVRLRVQLLRRQSLEEEEVVVAEEEEVVIAIDLYSFQMILHIYIFYIITMIICFIFVC